MTATDPTIPALPAGARVLVTGATGFTGAVLARQLVEAGCAVRAIARASSSLEALRDLPIEWVRGDVSDADTVALATQGVQFVFQQILERNQPQRVLLAESDRRDPHNAGIQQLTGAGCTCSLL